MFLDLGLQVGGVFVALIGGRLQLLVDPSLQLVRIPAEVLEAPGILQLLSLDAGGLLEVQVAAEDLFTTFLKKARFC